MITHPMKSTQIIKTKIKQMQIQFKPQHQQIQAIKQQLQLIPQLFEIFKQQTTASIKQWMGRISALVYRQSKEKMMLQSELDKSRQVQHTMRCEVIKLKEMINQAMSGYTKELQIKNSEIRRLKEFIQKSPISLNSCSEDRQSENIEQELEIIQEESQQTTFSSANTLRQSKHDEKMSQKVEKSVYEQQNSPILENKLSPVSLNEDNFQLNDKSHRKTKSFIENFSKSIQQSLPKPEQNCKPVTNESFLIKNKQNMIDSHQSISLQKVKIDKSLISQNTAVPLQNSIYVNTPLSFVNQSRVVRPKITFSIEQRDISSISSSSQLTRGSQQQNTQNLFVKKSQIQSIHSFFKRKEKQNNRVMTEPSPQRIRSSNNYFSNKPVQTPSHIRKSSQRPRSNEQSKSMKSSVSKQKIKVTCKMIEETTQPRRNNKAIIYLGGKSLFRKFLIQLKQAFKKYSISSGSNQDEVKYQGQRRNKIRWGRGRLFYKNGMVYQGQFRENVRHGKGSLYLNGISIYQGDWKMDKIQGEGYLKTMKYMSKDCPSIFNQASYCGHLQDNRLHGIGTIFLNPKQKLITKFNNGIPISELTYHNLQQIEFGVWPSQ